LELWISGTIDEVVAAVESGAAAAVATNPIIIADWTAGGRTLEDVVAETCQRVNVPVFVQLHGPDVDAYLREMDVLRRISPRLLPKLVATPDGIKAASRLAQEGVRPLVTAVSTLNQAFLAAAAGAAYVAPYYGRIESAGQDAAGLVENIATLYALHDIPTQIVAASVRNPAQAEACLLAGAHAVVVFYDVFQQMFKSDLTDAWIEDFERRWDRIPFEGRVRS